MVVVVLRVCGSLVGHVNSGGFRLLLSLFLSFVLTASLMFALSLSLSQSLSEGS